MQYKYTEMCCWVENREDGQWLHRVVCVPNEVDAAFRK